MVWSGGPMGAPSVRHHIPLAVLLAVAVRAPFWIEALRTPVDGDTAIIGLMARHLGRGTTMWGQPYGSPLEAWLAAPFVAALGPTAAALRLCYFLLGLGLIPVAYALGRALDPRAAFPAAVLVACPPPYFLLLSALPPPMYPASLLMCGALLVLAAGLGDRFAAGDWPVARLGTHAPLVADDPEHVVPAPRGAAAALVLVYGVGLVLAARSSSGSGAARLLLAAAALGLLAFPFPLRSGPGTIRFLTPLYVPIAALIAWGPVARGRPRRSWIVVLALCGLHLAGASRLLAAWRAADRAAAPFLLPDLGPARRVLEAHGLRRAYASYGPAYRLTYETGERIV